MDKLCMQCHAALRGRSDKKFCDDHCRSLYFSQQNKCTNDCIKFISSRLKKNRMILKKLHSQKKFTISLHHLPIFGLDLFFYTHIYKVENGDAYNMVYDYGYKHGPKNEIHIIHSTTNFLNLPLNDTIENMYSEILQKR